MDHWQKRVLLESIIYKTFRKLPLDKNEMKIIQEVIEIRDYGHILD